MNDLIKINRDTDGEATVSGRELHQALEIKTAYKDWFPRMVEYGFIEGEDFCSFLSESTGGRPATDHAITLDMAKEICMIQRTPQGRACRQYFIQAEKEYKNNCQNYQQLAERVGRLEELLTQQPKPIPQFKAVKQLPNLISKRRPRGGFGRAGSQSTIAKLPVQIRINVEYMLIDTQYMYDDIIEYLSSYGVKVAKSQLSRYYHTLIDEEID